MYRNEPNGYQLYDMDAVDLLGDYLETLRAMPERRACRRRRQRRNSAQGSSKSICCIARTRSPPPMTAFP